MGEFNKLNIASRFGYLSKFMKTMIIIVLLVGFIFIGILSGMVIGFIQAADSITEDDLMLKGVTTNIYDYKQRLVSPLHGDKNREMVDLKDTPKNLRDAFVAIEDKRFYEHPGIDLKRMAGALISFIKPESGTYGASTITQQVIKNLTGQSERTFKRKIQEQWKALQIERHLTKDQILETYMNIIYMGYNCYGVQAASKLYFNKDVSKLTLAECAIIAGITNAPSNYDPFTPKGRTSIKNRQEIILSEMLKMERITKKEHDSATNEPLKYAERSKNPNLNTTAQSYFIDQVVKDVKKGLIEKGYPEDLALKIIYNNGLKIYTTMDMDIQKHMDEVFTNMKNFKPVQKNLKPQAAMVILDSHTGYARALYGGAGVKTTSNFFNRATASDMMRQPGSTFKPIAVYGPAINQKLITAATVFDDVPIHLNGANKKRYPENYDLNYNGLMNVRDAIKISLNVVAAKVWTFENDFPQVSMEQYVSKLGIRREDETYVSAAMGGLNKGVNPLQMAAAYVPFVNKGAYYEPITFTKVVDTKGKVILENKIDPRIVFEPEAAYIMTNLLSEVTRAGGTAELYGKIQNGNMPSAGKTGTTSDNKDKWFVGFSPYYVGATWYGYDTPTPLINDEYFRAQILWHDVMEKVHQKLPPESFKEPSGIVHSNICKYSGRLAGPLCDKDPRGSAVRDELFLVGTEPQEQCNVHLSVSICNSSKDANGRFQLSSGNCPPSTVKEVVRIKRIKPFVPVSSEDPYPLDWVYEYPNSKCSVHSGGTISNDSLKNPAPVSGTPKDLNNATPDTNTKTVVNATGTPSNPLEQTNSSGNDVTKATPSTVPDAEDNSASSTKPSGTNSAAGTKPNADNNSSNVSNASNTNNPQTNNTTSNNSTQGKGSINNSGN